MSEICPPGFEFDVSVNALSGGLQMTALTDGIFQLFGDFNSDGDFDINGMVEFSDFLLLSNNFGKTSSSASTVPEPDGLMVVCLGLLGLVTFRRHHRLGDR
jgi:hypothetical protein